MASLTGKTEAVRKKFLSIQPRPLRGLSLLLLTAHPPRDSLLSLVTSRGAEACYTSSLVQRRKGTQRFLGFTARFTSRGGPVPLLCFVVRLPKNVALPTHAAFSSLSIPRLFSRPDWEGSHGANARNLPKCHQGLRSRIRVALASKVVHPRSPRASVASVCCLGPHPRNIHREL